ncbi:aminotransferase class I/II-fold pyridoxal phosphate-dependent enzyme [Streptomyces sp. WMMB 322]|uniref:aminotransferase class I/II-fold pyridoxal phosphate-dependent enzyme n=1 Tax=Streptomyces sp. WMMB 322 TaxID=1286821 RepID=UPI0006E16514|nr:aminotransferase class I/II-fold pyridoxal phosphate-dependent enzyme [Streptomyces sp. WMMB 322]SCK35396.1 Aspartate/methionine/tyrosine aminotransferase [Streptomyces sp. WMMB 322]
MEGSDGYRRTRSATAVAACGYWHRRGMETRPGQVVAAPGAELLLLAVLAATGPGTVLTPRPCETWYARPARLLGRPVRTVPVPVECGGVPDPVALRETAGRVRAEEPEPPRVLVLSVADDCTGTAVPPELLHEVVEAAGDERLLVVSDETWRETAHAPHSTVVVSPAEMVQGGRETDEVVVLAELGETLLPHGPAAGIARFPDSGRGQGLAEAVRGVLTSLLTGPAGPDDTAVADALTEPESLRARRVSTARAHGSVLAGLHRVLTGAGALCRPPRVGRHLYADFEPVRASLEAHGIRDSPGLEAQLVRMFGPFACGGHRFGDDPKALRVRLAGGLVADPDLPAPASAAGGRALESVESALTELTALRG